MSPNKNHDNLPKVTLTAPDGAQAEVYLHGAHVTSWRPADGEERLFLSERAEFEVGKAIRGGIPVCFPQFAEEGPILKHGFARLATWTLVRSAQVGDTSQAVLELEDSEATRAIWPYAFRARLTVTVGGPRLHLELTIQNTGTEPFRFTGALHTYLGVDDVARVAVEDLSGCGYRDAVTGISDNKQAEAEVHFDGEVDRIYRQCPAQLTVREPKRQMTVQATGFPDVVLWNPGPSRCAALKDMTRDGYRRMVCVEAAVVSEPPEVVPGAAWSGSQSLRAS